MAVKKTISILGATEEMGTIFAYNLARYNYRLLLISDDKSRLSKIISNIKKHIPTAEVVTSGCERDASWESDTILISAGQDSIEKAGKLCQVATQKPVIRIFRDEESRDRTLRLAGEEEFLPNSKVVDVVMNSIRTGGTIHGQDEEALNETSYILRLAGFYPHLATQEEKSVF